MEGRGGEGVVKIRHVQYFAYFNYVYNVIKLLTTQIILVQMIRGDHGLLEVHPSELRFPFQPRKSTTCSLDLTNHTYERVAFRLVEKQSEPNWEKQISFLSNLPMYGFIPSRSTYTLVVTIKEQPDPPEDTNLDLLLQSSISGDKFIVPFKNETECVDLFKELKETGDAVVHAATLKAVSYPQGEVTDEVSSLLFFS